MGCSPSHEYPSHRLTSPDSMDTESEWSGDEAETPMPEHRVHWDEPEPFDYETQYTGASRGVSSYGSRLMSARGSRARLGSAATGMSEYLAEYDVVLHISWKLTSKRETYCYFLYGLVVDLNYLSSLNQLESASIFSF